MRLLIDTLELKVIVACPDFGDFVVIKTTPKAAREP